MMFGGGVTDFSSPTVRDMTGTGGAWDVRLIFGQREVLALETAYVGSAHYISALGLDNDAMLVSNGAEGVLRLNIPVIDHGSIIEPFGFVGPRLVALRADADRVQPLERLDRPTT